VWYLEYISTRTLCNKNRVVKIKSRKILLKYLNILQKKSECFESTIKISQKY